ncbi:hypothetical protein GCM10009557_61800 [Virgisporangium ochraceum]|uniref:Uncharacterized protein n=2 Tax=Virgisporangium ochraceum TaxID=65505 RepID=A0A8J3ZXQ8_9ACTN|nr:hypothetical protein Voc01_064830 [Virgisporangium ochraceum]
MACTGGSEPATRRLRRYRELIQRRLAQIIVGSFAARNSSHFGGPALGGHAAECWRNFAYAGTADEALEHEPMAMLVLHVNREVIHHGAEIALLRDLYRVRHEFVRPPA